MNGANAQPITLKATPDVRQQLQQWAQDNMTSLSAEMVRAIRERAEREQREQEARR